MVADALCSRQVLTPRDAVVQSFIIDPPALELTLQRFVAIDTELGRIGKIGAELYKERSEVFIQTVEIVEVHIGAAVIDPWDRSAMAKGLAHRSGHARLFLGHADKDHSLLMLLFESAQPCLHDIVLALALFKPDQIDFVIEPKLHDRFHKSVSHLCDLLGGGKAISQMPAHKACNPRPRWSVAARKHSDTSGQYTPVLRQHVRAGVRQRFC